MVQQFYDTAIKWVNASDSDVTCQAQSLGLFVQWRHLEWSSRGEILCFLYKFSHKTEFDYDKSADNQSAPDSNGSSSLAHASLAALLQLLLQTAEQREGQG